MKESFDSFVVFAQMRTGSNFLEANLNALDGVTCHGEAFNPHFIGYPKSDEILGVSYDERLHDPQVLLETIKNADGFRGFRFFHDHEPRILDQVINDPRIAKVILTRNPIESYISWKIAQATGQWKLTHVKRRKSVKARFDAAEFETHMAALQGFQLRLMNNLQKTAQSAFYIDYDDLHDLDVLNGLAKWLGLAARLDGIDTSLKVQNPESLSEKVENFADMEQTLARMDRFNLARTPNFEPRRGPVVPSYLAGFKTPLLYMPVRSGPEETVRSWLAALDDVQQEDLLGAFSQTSLRTWKRERPGHRSFTVIRHPVLRAHEAFCSKILAMGPGSFTSIRKTLRRVHKLPIPDAAPGPDYDKDTHRAAFASYLKWVRANLNGQTAMRVDGHWASQAQTIESMSVFALPDMIVREQEMNDYLPALAMQAGHPGPMEPGQSHETGPFALAEIYDEEIEQLCRDAYPRDYLTFGFADWQKT